MKKFVFILILAIPLLAVLDTQAEKGDLANTEAEVTVEFSEDCRCVTVTSSKDLSNVVILYDPDCEIGQEVVRIEDLEGYEFTWCVPDDVPDGVIWTVWVKSGNNKSGDGPGYGERFDSGCTIH